MITVVLFNPGHSMILCFYDSDTKISENIILLCRQLSLSLFLFCSQSSQDLFSAFSFFLKFTIQKGSICYYLQLKKKSGFLRSCLPINCVPSFPSNFVLIGLFLLILTLLASFRLQLYLFKFQHVKSIHTNSYMNMQKHFFLRLLYASNYFHIVFAP